jgi:hypothetical protein
MASSKGEGGGCLQLLNPQIKAVVDGVRFLESVDKMSPSKTLDVTISISKTRYLYAMRSLHGELTMAYEKLMTFSTINTESFNLAINK